MKVGVLALQGGFQRHLAMLQQIGVDAIDVRYAAQLSTCDALILPGGESTTMTHLLLTENLWQPIYDFIQGHPVFGTCAGAILLSKNAHDARVKPFEMLGAEADRNAYGRQVDSFTATLNLTKIGEPEYKAVFIRAPQLRIVDDEVEILAEENGRPVLIRQGHVLAATFHPELTANPAVHRYFVESVVQHHQTSSNKVPTHV